MAQREQWKYPEHFNQLFRIHNLSLIISKPSLQRASNIFNISLGSVQRILKKHKFPRYKLKNCPITSRKRLCSKNLFAEEMLDKSLHSQDFLQHITFEDEAHFHIHSGVNTHNFHYWCPTNPHCNFISHFIHLEHRYGRPFGMEELSAHFFLYKCKW